ncbi:nipped-B cohesin loading factor isoform 2-T4 [Glossina fuscipes fuscipes]
MSERDIPSVPVTTLAGLTSLSDLLSELPVAESLGHAASLNRTLLFHTLVASESKNLLSVRDENLTRQLVHAIEQTNSDNIQLKPQYALQQHGANISTYPELLQGIYNFRPTVFNIPQNNVAHPAQITAPQNTVLANTNLPSIAVSSHISSQQHNEHRPYPIHQPQAHSQPLPLVPLIDQRVTNKPADSANSNLMVNTHETQTREIIQNAPNLPHENPMPKEQTNCLPPVNLAAKAFNNNCSTIKNVQETSVQQQEIKIEESEIVQATQESKVCGKETSAVEAEAGITTTKVENENTPCNNIQTQLAPIQGNFQNVLNLHRQHFGGNIQQHKQLAPVNSNITPSEKVVKSENAICQPPIGKETTNNSSLQTTADATITLPLSSAQVCPNSADKPNNSNSDKPNLRVCINRLKAEDVRLMQQSIKTFIQKSPELAKKVGLLTTESEFKLLPQQIQSVTSCANTPVNSANCVPNAPTTEAEEKRITKDTFTIMKADEKQSTAKRKLPITIDDIPPDQIFSKPKVRRVERVIPSHTSKCSKDDVLRSQTYQQFMRNMEQIIELLDDTESPNFESDDIDENIECISSKMLNTMSNDVAKLKAKNVLDLIPKNKLTLLINYAMRNIYLAKNYSAGPDDEEEIIDDDVMEKILNGIESCLLICNIYSTVNDLKFLQEDNISVIIKFMQFQLRETIFPSYDPVYTVKNMKKSSNRGRSKAYQNHSRNLHLLYSKVVELMKVFVMLFDKCFFVDTIVLPLSTLAIEPFFVDNIDTLQFVCLELVTTIFRKEQYEKIRSSILCDILASIDRLPSSKKNLRPFKLTNNGGNIQMVTALVLQLIQCATILPDALCVTDSSKNVQINDNDISESSSRIKKPNTDVVVLKKYEVAISIGGNFLTTFLNKCKTRSNETDFRPLFENFIHDLLSTVNKPEWPASELLLSLLGTMLVRYVSDKSIEQSIRLVSLDYLGIVASRLRKDTVESRCKVNIIDSMIKSIKLEQEREGDLTITNNKIEVDPEEERTEFLQKILLDFLAVNAQEENLIWDYARHFYLAQWYRDIICQRKRIAEGDKHYASRKKTSKRKKHRKGLSSTSSESDSCNESGEDGRIPNENSRRTDIIDQELNLEIFNILEQRKAFLISKIKPYSLSNDISHASHIKTYIDYTNAHLIAQYLATKRPFSQSFDGYLKKIILVVNEPSIAVRTRAMKCLANIVEVDPFVLKRKDMQMGVNQKFLDAAISVREAAVDLVGKFVLSNEELIDQYYDMLSTRILDTGVSVRKRVIKILRDICIEYPDFKKIPEICVKMIRRVNDEEGIQKLVTEVFMKMWFTPCNRNDKHGIQRKINQIIDVVNTAHDTGTTWLEGLLNSIFQPKENMLKTDGNTQDPVKKNTEPPQEIVLACQQLADGLVDRLIELEDTDNERMLGCITTLHLLAKVRPQLLVRHAMTIEPYLNIKCHPSTAPKFICAVADILEKVVPLVNNASESFLASLEEHLMLLVVSLNQAVVSSCVSCLGAVVNKITKNYKLIRDCFQKFYRILDYSRNQVVKNNHSIDEIYTPMFRRSLFTIGILMRYFDFKAPHVIGDASGGGFSVTICDDAFECLMFFTHCSNCEIRKQALIALGSFCVMNDDYLIRSELKQFYCDILRSDKTEPGIKIICMRNIWIYLTESEMCMYNKEKEWEKQCKNEDLKEMNDVSSGMASRIIQLYLQEILDCFLNRDDAVRLWAVKVVQIVLRQGLVHPVRMVPYLICLSTDSKLESAHRADALLKDIDKTYSGFVNMKVQFGLQLCFKLQELLQCNNKGKVGNIIRGYVKRESDAMPTALNDFLYTLLRTTKPQRRALVQTVTKQFDDQKTQLRQMLYIADNMAYFPFVVQDEPLYLIHQIDLLISMAGTNILATFKECLKPGENSGDILEDDDDEEDSAVLFKRLPDNTLEIEKCITSAQACMLLLVLKEHLKDMYSLTDSKISRYSPSETKLYEKAVTRKNVPDFNPKTTIDIIKKQQDQINAASNDVAIKPLTDEEKMDLVVKYLDFKQLMLKLDPDDVESEEEMYDKSKLNSTMLTDITPTTSVLNSTGAYQSPNESGASGTINMANLSSPNFGNRSKNHIFSTPTPIKESPVTPTSRTTRSVIVAKPTAIRKAAHKGKRKKRRMISSDEDDDECSDIDEYA